MSRLSVKEGKPSAPKTKRKGEAAASPSCEEKNPSQLSQWILSVLDLLEDMWHNEAEPPKLGHGEPLDGLILTVLSQNTNDRNRDMAFAQLKERFFSPTAPADEPQGWEAVASAGAQALEDAIRPAGLAPTKAGYILNILDTVKRDFGGYTILPLKERGRDAAREYLTALPGVGAKTAACVLLFDMGIPAFPVDTHIGRISRRVGFVPEKMPAEIISMVLEREVPPARYLGGHVNMIEHGRGVCHARKPQCGACPLTALCGMGRAQIAAAMAEEMGLPQP